MRSLRMRRPSGPRMSPHEEDDLSRMLAAAQLVGWRIVNGITEQDMAARMGYINTETLPRRGKRRQAAINKGTAELRRTELKLIDGRLSTFQRYCRALGLRFKPALVGRRRVNLVARSRAIRSQQRTAAKRYQHHLQRRRGRVWL